MEMLEQYSPEGPQAYCQSYYTLRMYTIAIGKELGLPMEDSWAREDLDELPD